MPKNKFFLSKVDSRLRFGFGANWLKFAKLIDEIRITEAENSLNFMLGIDDLKGKSFLDVGSGSGLFSLAARRLGARVVSFDYDPQSVECAKELKNRFYRDDSNWIIESGSVLDFDYMKSLGKFDYVYAWGVLHHTGNMWVALENIKINVSDNGRIFISLYNYQPFISIYWLNIKKLYNSFLVFRPIIFICHFIYPVLPSFFIKLFSKNKRPRGMSLVYDLIDWLGGYPFEVSTPEQIVDFYIKDDFFLGKIVTVGGRHGCNEYIFEKKPL